MLKECWFSRLRVFRIKSLCIVCLSFNLCLKICLHFSGWFSVRISFLYIERGQETKLRTSLSIFGNGALYMILGNHMILFVA
jgi:hypothetical protein